MQQQRKPSKVNQLATLRSFIAGEDVVSELLQTAIIITWFETHNLFDAEDRIMINGKPCTMQQYEQALAESSFKWVEERTYDQERDKEESWGSIGDSEYSDRIEKEASHDPEINAQARELRNRSKDYLTNKLQEFAEQERLALEIRKQSILWKRMNESL